MCFLIATDLDGTLLDHHTYRWQAALEAIALCAENKIPIVFNTSKTLKEAQHLQSKIGIEGPMIVENGSALILPKKYLNSKLDFDYLRSSGVDSARLVISNEGVEVLFGEPRRNLLAFINEMREQQGWLLEGFNDWSNEQIAQHTGLDIEDAALASHKFYSEPFIWNDTDKSLQVFITRALNSGYKVLRGGRFYHLQGNTNKALPIVWLKQHILPLYGANCSSIDEIASKYEPELICLGDNQNDIDMLNVADFPVCVRSPVSDFPQLETNNSVIFTDGEGPVGWNEAINKIIKQ